MIFLPLSITLMGVLFSNVRRAEEYLNVDEPEPPTFHLVDGRNNNGDGRSSDGSSTTMTAIMQPLADFTGCKAVWEQVATTTTTSVGEGAVEARGKENFPVHFEKLPDGTLIHRGLSPSSLVNEQQQQYEEEETKEGGIGDLESPEIDLQKQQQQHGGHHLERQQQQAPDQEDEERELALIALGLAGTGSGWAMMNVGKDTIKGGSEEDNNNSNDPFGLLGNFMGSSEDDSQDVNDGKPSQQEQQQSQRAVVPSSSSSSPIFNTAGDDTVDVEAPLSERAR
jgi:hypothetical protein